MLDGLARALSNAIAKITRKPIIDKKAINEYIRDLQRALLSADVNVKLVFELSENIKKRVFSEKIPPGVSLKEILIHSTYEELKKLMGTASSPIPKGKASIMFVGIQGSGKTTTIAKYANFLRKHGKKVGIICADTYRPAAYEQLKQLGDKINVPVFFIRGTKDPRKIVEKGLEEFKDYDVILIDTAGRHKDEASLMNEIRELNTMIKPTEVVLVIDATIGQQAYSQAEAFKKVTEVGSIVITKLDGTAKGGGAISAAAAAGAPIKFVGTGEKIEDFEEFDPEGFVSRLLGIPDLKTLLKKVQEAKITISKKKVASILRGKFTLRDFYEQMENLHKIGPLERIWEHLGIKQRLSDEERKRIKEMLRKWKYIMQSMTREELENPEIIKHSRIRRIAKGAGVREEDVRELLKRYKQTVKMLKRMDKRKLARMGFMQL